jgi:hypothetical protein
VKFDIYHVEEFTGVLQELTSENNGQIGTITDLFLLHVRGKQKQLRSWVLNLFF